MDQYLLQILKETNTIIIPDLGALTITNAEKNEVMFMPYLKHDDGKLSDHISAKEGIDANEAKNIIAKHVREIKTKLDQGETYVMFQFGTFMKGTDGDVEFENWDGKAADEVKAEKPKAESPKPTPVVEKPKVEKPKAKSPKPTPVVEKPKVEKPKAESPKPTPVVEKPKAEKPKAENPKPTPVVEEPKVEKPKVESPKPTPIVEKPKVEKPKPEAKKEEPKKSTPKVASTVAAASSAPTPKKEMNIAEKEELSKSVDKLNDLKKQKEDGKKKKKRGVGFYMLMVFLVLIIAGGTYVAIDYDNVKQHIPFLADKEEAPEKSDDLEDMKKMVGSEDEVNDSDKEMESDSADTDPENDEPAIEEPIIEEPIAETPVVSPSGGGSFHIIAGAFGNADNANRMVEKLKAKGYGASTIDRGTSTLVSVQSYGSNAEAQSALADVKDVAPSGWILEWK